MEAPNRRHPDERTDGKFSRHPNGSAPESARLSDGFEAQRNFGSCGVIRRRFAEHDTHQAIEFPGNTLALCRQRRGVQSLDQPYCGVGRIAPERIRSRCQLYKTMPREKISLAAVMGCRTSSGDMYPRVPTGNCSSARLVPACRASPKSRTFILKTAVSR
jgi:hypothetical protein